MFRNTTHPPLGVFVFCPPVLFSVMGCCDTPLLFYFNIWGTIIIVDPGVRLSSKHWYILGICHSKCVFLAKCSCPPLSRHLCSRRSSRRRSMRNSSRRRRRSSREENLPKVFFPFPNYPPWWCPIILSKNFTAG